MEVHESQTLLRVDNIHKSYGVVSVLEGISLAVRRGELLGIIGPNGSGKTTLFGVISGTLSPNEGAVFLNGENITRLKASERAKAGVGRTFQVPQSFAEMTVFENLLVAARFGACLAGREADRFVMEILERTHFAARADMLAGALPLLDRKRLELARALATRPKLLLLDEIAGGLTDDEAQELATTIVGLADQGVAVIWIEHLVHVLTHAVHRLLVLGNGQVIADGEPHATMQRSAVRQIYLGLEPDTHDLD